MSAAFLELVDLASERLGAAVVAANDEFFAPKENLIKAERADLDRRRVHRSAASGWTAGRRAGAASRGTTGASCGSACPGVVRGVDVDTAFFKGNYPESCAIDVCELPTGHPADG